LLLNLGIIVVILKTNALAAFIDVQSAWNTEFLHV
jgi:hypothetical protein